MTSQLEHDLATSRAHLEAARRELLDAISQLTEGDLDRGPRGHWPVRRILEHVIWHEEIYVRMAAHIRGQGNPGEMPDTTPASVSDALARLEASRTALLAAIDGIDEESFYKLVKMGYEEYSVLSMLENEANHEREHAEQIKKTVAR